MSNLARTLVVIESNNGNTFAIEKIADGTLELLHNADHIAKAIEVNSFDAGMLKMADVRKAAAQCNHFHDRDEFARELYKALQAATVGVPAVGVHSTPCRVLTTETVGEGLECVSESLTPVASTDSSTDSPVASTDWPIPPRYRLGAELGSGSYACVRQAWDKEGKRKVAVKEVRLSTMDKEDQTRILRELKLLKGLNHTHIIQIFDMYFSQLRCNSNVYMILECCDTDLERILEDERALSMPVTRRLAYNLCVGCTYLHANGIYHRDLKPANCLANKDCSVKICDFNLSRFVGHEGVRSENSVVQPLQRNLTQDVVTCEYRAPEVILKLPYTEALDVWSFGCILAELFKALNKEMFPGSLPLFPGDEAYLSPDDYKCGDPLGNIIAVLGTPINQPQFKLLPEDAQNRIKMWRPHPRKNLRDQVPPEVPDEGQDLLCALLKFFHKERITMADALSHRFFDKVKRSSDEQVEDCELGLDFDESRLQRRPNLFQEFKKEANQTRH